jgi:hypothetical protein
MVILFRICLFSSENIMGYTNTLKSRLDLRLNWGNLCYKRSITGSEPVSYYGTYRKLNGKVPNLSWHKSQLKYRLQNAIPSYVHIPEVTFHLPAFCLKQWSKIVKVMIMTDILEWHILSYTVCVRHKDNNLSKEISKYHTGSNSLITEGNTNSSIFTRWKVMTSKAKVLQKTNLSKIFLCLILPTVSQAA